MLERQRQQYLSLLGIDNYVPRRILLSAAASVLLTDEQIGNILPAVAVNVVADSHEQHQQHTASLQNTNSHSNSSQNSAIPANDDSTDDKPASVMSAVSSVLDMAVTTSSDIIRDKQTQDSAIDLNKASTPDKELQFVLSVWRIRNELLVVDSRQPGAAYPTDRLLQNILRAIGYPLAQLPASDIVRWPLFVNHKNTQSILKHNQDADQARAMVHAYIHAQMSQYPLKALLLMGDNAARFGLNGFGAESLVDINIDTLDTSSWPIPVVVTHSLFSLLQEPHLKAQAWAALQKIIVRSE